MVALIPNAPSLSRLLTPIERDVFTYIDDRHTTDGIRTAIHELVNHFDMRSFFVCVVLVELESLHFIEFIISADDDELRVTPKGSQRDDDKVVRLEAIEPPTLPASQRGERRIS